MALKLADTGQDEARNRDEREICMCQFLLLFYQYFTVGLEEMRTEQKGRVLHKAIGMALYCQKDDPERHLFCWLFVQDKLSSLYVHGARFENNIFESPGSKKAALPQVMSRLSPFNCFCNSMR